MHKCGVQRNGPINITTVPSAASESTKIMIRFFVTNGPSTAIAIETARHFFAIDLMRGVTHVLLVFVSVRVSTMSQVTYRRKVSVLRFQSDRKGLATVTKPLQRDTWVSLLFSCTFRRAGSTATRSE